MGFCRILTDQGLQNRDKNGHGVLWVASLVMVVQAGSGVDLEDHPAGVSQRPLAVWRYHVNAGQAHTEQGGGAGGVGHQNVCHLVSDALIELAAVGVDHGLDEHRGARRRYRSGRHALVFECEDRVQVGYELPRRCAAVLAIPSEVLRGKQIRNRRPTVSENPWRKATHDIKEPTVQEQEAIVVAGHLPLDQEPLRDAPRSEPSAAKLRFRAYAGRRHRPPLQVDRLDHAGTVVSCQERERGLQVLDVEERVFGHRQAVGVEDPMYQRLVQRQLQRDDVVERHPVIPDDHSPVAHSHLHEAPCQIGRRSSQLTCRIRPALHVARPPPVRRECPCRLAIAALMPRIAHADRTHQIEARTHRPADGSGTSNSVKQVLQQRQFDILCKTGHAHAHARCRYRINVVDLHCHVLPGIDDGPPRLDDSLALARVARSQGTTTLVATPHVSWRYVNDPSIIAREVKAVRGAIREAGLDLRIQSGAEIAVPRLGDLTDEALCELRLGDGPWLLIESPLTLEAGDLEGVLDAVQRRGHWIVLAHPERSPLFLRNPQRLGSIVAKGVLCSITASSLSGAFGQRIQSFAAALIHEGLVHNVSSDAHDVDRRPPVVRCHIEAATAHVPELAGRIEWLTCEVPQAIITGEVLPKPPERNPTRPRRSR